MGVELKETNTSPIGRPSSLSTVRRTTEKGSGGTWSRSSWNSATSSSGKMPSPDERIWPSLMYVGPRRSKATRKRRDRPARERSVPRSLSHQASSALPMRTHTATTRAGLGRSVEETSWRASAAACARRSSTPTRSGPDWRQGIEAGSTVQGPRRVNAPMARSGESPSSGSREVCGPGVCPFSTTAEGAKGSPGSVPSVGVSVVTDASMATP
jgi:hypothetical protein